MVARAQKGGCLWKEPAGFALARSGNIPILQPSPPLSDAILAVLLDFLAGEITKSQGVAKLRKAGLKIGNAHNVFKLPVYGGIIRLKLADGDVKAAFPGLITAEEWYKIEDKLAKKGKTSALPRQRRIFIDRYFILWAMRGAIMGVQRHRAQSQIPLLPVQKKPHQHTCRASGCSPFRPLRKIFRAFGHDGNRQTEHT